MPSNSYDLVVLGDDLAALVCATLCQRRGMRTLMLGDDRPARYTLGPHKLPVEPASWPGAAGSAGERVLKELHAELALRRKLREPKIAAQLVAPDLRVDLGGDRLAGELEREVGAAAPDWLARWDRAAEVARLFDPVLTGEHAFPGVGFFEKRELARLTEQAAEAAAAWWADAERDPHAAQWRQLATIAQRHPAPAPIAIARAVTAWRAGPAALRGDGDAIRELLTEKLTTAGGEVRAGKVTELGVSWGKLTGLTLQNGDEIGAGQVVSSRPPAELAELLGKKAPRRLSELAEAVQLVGYRYTLNVVLDEAGLPEHMAPTVAVIGAASGPAPGSVIGSASGSASGAVSGAASGFSGPAPIGDPAFSIHLGETDDGGRVVATIAAILACDGPLDADHRAARCSELRAALWQRLGEVMPFFERHLVLAHSPFEATAPHVPGGRGSHDVPRNLPFAMAPIWRGQLAQTADTGAQPYTTGVKNLTLTGDQILPGLGVEGAVTAGWSAAKIACAIAGKKKDYLRDEVVGAA